KTEITSGSTRSSNRTRRSGIRFAIWTPATADTSGTSSGEPLVLVDALGESFQARDPLVDRRVRAEHPDEGAGGERVHDEQALGRRAAEGERSSLVRHFQLLERRGWGEWLSDRLRAAVVGLVLSAPGDRELDEDGRNGREDHPDERQDERARVSVPIPGAAPEEHVPAEHPGHERDRPGEGRSH